MAIEKTYITLNNLDENKTVSTKLYIDQYSSTELEKALDVKVSELIKGMPDVNLDLVPKPVYDTELSHSADLQVQINILTADNDSLKARVQVLLADSSSLYTDNDGLRVSVAKLENTVASVQQTTLELRTNLTTSLTKAINEATERTALEAENNGLNAQKNALIKQIDTLNNLLAQANATLQVAQQQLSAKAQAVAAGGLSTGELSTIVFDAGDVSKFKEPNKIYLDCGDWGGHHGPKYANDPKGYYPAGDPYTSQAVKYFDVVAGPKDITINLSFTGQTTINPFDMGITFPVSLKANETKRFEMGKVNTSWTQNGAYDTGFWSTYWHPSPYNMDMKIEVKDIDTAGKTESKTFALTIYKYWKL